MALEELIMLETISVDSEVNVKSTYTIINMKLTKLFDEVLTEVEKGILPLLEMHILLYSLRNVAFVDEIESNIILLELKECINQQLYGRDRQWSCNAILNKLECLSVLIAHDIIINGSLICQLDREIEWDLYPPIYNPLETKLIPQQYSF